MWFYFLWTTIFFNLKCLLASSHTLSIFSKMSRFRFVSTTISRSICLSIINSCYVQISSLFLFFFCIQPSVNGSKHLVFQRRGRMKCLSILSRRVFGQVLCMLLKHVKYENRQLQACGHLFRLSRSVSTHVVKYIKNFLIFQTQLLSLELTDNMTVYYLFIFLIIY